MCWVLQKKSKQFYDTSPIDKDYKDNFEFFSQTPLFIITSIYTCELAESQIIYSILLVKIWNVLRLFFWGGTSFHGVGQSLSNTVHTKSILSENERIEFICLFVWPIFGSFDVIVKNFCCLRSVLYFLKWLPLVNQLIVFYVSVSQPLWDRGPVNSFFIRRGPGPNRFTRQYFSNFF